MVDANLKVVTLSYRYGVRSRDAQTSGWWKMEARTEFLAMSSCIPEVEVFTTISQGKVKREGKVRVHLDLGNLSKRAPKS